jgi:hypothetical protein
MARFVPHAIFGKMRITMAYKHAFFSTLSGLIVCAAMTAPLTFSQPAASRIHLKNGNTVQCPQGVQILNDQKTARCLQGGWDMDISLDQVNVKKTFGQTGSAELKNHQTTAHQSRSKNGKDSTSRIHSRRHAKSNRSIEKFIACYNDKNCREIRQYSTAELVNLFQYNGQVHHPVESGTVSSFLGGYSVALVDYEENITTQEAIYSILVYREKHRQGIDPALLNGLRSSNSNIRWWSFVTCERLPQAKKSSKFAAEAIKLISDKKLAERAMWFCSSNTSALKNRLLPNKLIQVMQNRHFTPHTRVIAINTFSRVLGKNSPPYVNLLKKKITPVLKKLTKDPSAKVRTAASNMLICNLKNKEEITKRDQHNKKVDLLNSRVPKKSIPINPR